MSSKHRKTLEAVFTDPVNGVLGWAHLEALLRAMGGKVIEGLGLSVTFEKAAIRAHFHRPHPDKEILRYRIRAAREYLQTLGIKP